MQGVVVVVVDMLLVQVASGGAVLESEGIERAELASRMLDDEYFIISARERNSLQQLANA